MEELKIEDTILQLEEAVRKAGFPEEVLPLLRDKIQAGDEEGFYLPYKASIAGEQVKGELYFEESLLWQSYHWRKFTLALGKDSDALIKDNVFLVGHGYDTSLREAYNLMQGRYVFKEPSFDKDNLGFWTYLDIGESMYGFSRLVYYRNNFRVEAALSEPPLGYLLNETQKKELTDALKQGDRKELDLANLGIQRKVWAEASPTYGKIKLTDVNGNAVHLRGPFLHPNVEIPEQRYGKGKWR